MAISNPTPGTVNFGTCWGTPSGQDLSMPSYMASGFQVVAEAVLRRWSTSRGQLLDDQNYGFNLTDLVNANLSPSDISYAQQQAASEAAKDARVSSAIVTITLPRSGALTATAVVTTAQGPFQMVVSVDAVATLLIQVKS